MLSIRSGDLYEASFNFFFFFFLDKNRIQATRKKDREKPRKLDSFINDESLSDNDSESMYHTALTNPRTSTNSTASRPMAVPASVKRYTCLRCTLSFVYLCNGVTFNK